MRSNLFKLAQAAVLVAAMAFTFSCSSGDDGGGGSISGYKTKQIGTQVWMLQNLNYDVPGSKCYNDDPANCVKYGRLYDWATAMALPASCNSSSCSAQIQPKHRGICPSGWHIPSDAEWTILTDFVGGEETAGTKLKSKTGWESLSGVPAGTDEYGFAALPGGKIGSGSGGSFYGVGYLGGWWSATEEDEEDGGADDYAYTREMDYRNEYVTKDNNGKERVFSVRCLQN